MILITAIMISTNKVVLDGDYYENNSPTQPLNIFSSFYPPFLTSSLQLPTFEYGPDALTPNFANEVLIKTKFSDEVSTTYNAWNDKYLHPVCGAFWGSFKNVLVMPSKLGLNIVYKFN